MADLNAHASSSVRVDLPDYTGWLGLLLITQIVQTVLAIIWVVKH